MGLVMMNNMTQRFNDSQKERALLPILKEFLERELPDAEIRFTNSREEQLQGSDFLMKSLQVFGDNNFHTIDAKAATDYIVIDGRSDGLPTFAMELASLQNGNYREGWAIDNESYYKNTEYFCFQWIFTRNNTRDLSIQNIARIEVKIIPKRDLLHFIQNPFNLFPNLTNNGYIGELNQERISNLYIWMENTFNSLRGNQDGDYRFNNLNVKLQRGRLYLSLLNPNEVDGKGPKIVYTSEEVKSECPLNITIAKRPYLEKLSIFSSNLN